MKRRLSFLLLACAPACADHAVAADASRGTTKARAAMIRSIRSRVAQAAPSAVDEFLDRSLVAIASVPREAFVPPKLRKRAYGPVPLPIGYQQTITDAYAIAVMTAALHLPPHADVLDVGTGSGYQAAVLARLADHVSSVEIVEPLAIAAKERLARLGYRNVEVRAGDGFAGWPEHAPFDGIVVAAGASEIPRPLLEQLKPGARLVMPIGPSWATEQVLVVTKTSDSATSTCSLGWTMFVPLTGRGARPANAAGPLKNVPLCYEAPLVYPVFMPPGVASDIDARSPQ